METRYVGKSVPRVDGLEKVTGQAVYSVDVGMPGMLYGAVLRSPHAHARIVNVETADARKAPGVRAIVTGKDMPYTFGSMIKDQPFLAIDRVRFVGEPVAAVAAESQLEAQEALKKIRVEYAELPAVFDPREALQEGAPVLHPDMEGYWHAPVYVGIPGTNVCTVRRLAIGDVERGFSEADEVFEDEFYIHAVAHSPMETHAAVAQYFPSRDEYVLWSATDRPYRLSRDLAQALGIPVNKVRFVSTCVGGGFGGKGAMVAEVLAAALARFTKGRPVKVVCSREEELTASQTRHAAFMKLKTGVTRDGIFTARRAEVIWDNGAYSSLGPDVAWRGVLTILGPYRIPHLEIFSRLVYTNKEIGGAYRGFGTTQVTWACEMQMDIIAQHLKIDPLEIRMKNGYVDGDLYINGQNLQTVGLLESLKKAGEEIGWGRPKAAPAGTKYRGKGIATMIKPTATPTDSYCFIRVNHDAGIVILTGSPEVGGGQKTVLAQIAADTIGVPLSAIVVPNTDTHSAPYDMAVASSRTTYHMGNAVRQASEEVRRKILESAGRVLERDPESL
ncbi:MAG: molybdopterin cofactor-binding domain-containing protein, partial [Thermodesulfobacteriota bacterium]